MMEKYLAYLETWLAEELEYRGADGFIIGVSGGIDSAVVAHLLARKFSDKTTAVILPCLSNPNDAVHAKLVLDSCGLPYETVDLTSTRAELFAQLEPIVTKDLSVDMKVLDGNIRARLRMISLFALAQAKNYLVVGTDNLIEWYMGYFTKFGDGGVDIAPLIHLTKSEVREAGRVLGVPTPIIDQAPSAGLWIGQTDEDEMGVTYAEIEAFLAGEPVSDVVQARIAYWHNRSHHKREMIRVPEKQYK